MIMQRNEKEKKRREKTGAVTMNFPKVNFSGLCCVRYTRFGIESIMTI